ncbi:MAG: hypothetical protein WB853_00480 [Desulfobacterales bacterium]
MFSPMAAESLRADELEERIQLRVGARVRELRQAEAENEALNISRFKATYLKVPLDPWRVAVARARADLLGEGLLDSETAAVVAAAEPPMEGKPVP